MKHRILLPFVAFVAVLVGPAVATAGITEIAPLGSSTAGCPGFAPVDCKVVVARQTGFQAKVGTTKAFTTAKTSGTVVAWSISLVGVAAAKVKDVSTSYGGPPKAAIIILQPLGKSQFKVVGKGPLVDLTKYLGTSPTFALPTALPIKAGQVVAITVPTWAPMLQLGVASDTSWRSSKPLKESVANPPDYRAQRALVGTTTQGFFGALYQRARLAYSASMVPTPAVVKAPKTTPTKTPKAK